MFMTNKQFQATLKMYPGQEPVRNKRNLEAQALDYDLCRLRSGAQNL